MISLVPASYGDLGVSEEFMQYSEEQRKKQEEEARRTRPMDYSFLMLWDLLYVGFKICDGVA